MLMLIITFTEFITRSSITAGKRILREVDIGRQLAHHLGALLTAHVHSEEATLASEQAVHLGQALAHISRHQLHPREAEGDVGQVGRGEEGIAHLLHLLLRVQRTDDDMNAGASFFDHDGVGGETVKEEEDGEDATSKEAKPGRVEGEGKS